MNNIKINGQRQNKEKIIKVRKQARKSLLIRVDEEQLHQPSHFVFRRRLMINLVDMRICISNIK